MKEANHGTYIQRGAGDMDLVALYQEYFPKIYNYFFYRLLHKENAEDLTSQTFLKVATHLRKYDPQKASFGTWIFRIAENTLIDFYRAQKRVESTDSEDFSANPLLSVSFDEQYERIANPKRRALFSALRTLSERDRALVYDKYLLGHSYHEISCAYSINESTLATVLQRAKQKMRTELEKQGY